MYGCCQINLVVEALRWVGGEKKMTRYRFVLVPKSRIDGGLVMGMPLLWHRRHAMILAGQLPEDPTDAALVLQAVQELLQTFLSQVPSEEPKRADNVLPFAAG